MVLPDPSSLPDLVAARPGGARLLAALEDERGVHLVGGAVRDLLLGREPHEWDLVAEEDGAGVAARLGEAGRSHERFGTATVRTGDGLPVDVATARGESYPAPGALPVVRPGTVGEDMTRRDFTVNAIAVGLSPDRRGVVHRAGEALDDLAAGRLRVLHDASFTDDPTRLLRLARYAARLGFAVEPRTLELARAAVREGATAGPARMGAELMRLLGEEPAVAIAALEVLRDDLGMAYAFDADRLARAVALLPEDGRPDLLLLAALAHARPEILEGMHVKSPAPVHDAMRDPEGLAEAMAAAARPSDLWRLLHRRAPEAVALAGASGGAEAAARRWFGEVRDVPLAITGEDLIAEGLAPGPELGARLEAARAAALDDGADTREAQLAAALAFRP